MGQQQSQSKDELLYDQVNYGNVEGIKALRREGAGLEVYDHKFFSIFCPALSLCPVPVKTFNFFFDYG